MTGKQTFDARANTSLLEKRFIAKVLAETAQEIEEAQGTAILQHNLIKNRFMLQDRSHQIMPASDAYSGQATLSFLKYLRFHDMKKKPAPGRLRTKGKAYPVYNKIIFGQLNEVYKKLRFGFTEEVKQKLATELTIEIST